MRQINKKSQTNLDEIYLLSQTEAVPVENEIDPYLAEISRRVLFSLKDEDEGDDLPENVLQWIN
jgi:hypothetical protein